MGALKNPRRVLFGRVQVRSLLWISAAVILVLSTAPLARIQWEAITAAITERATSEITGITRDLRLNPEAWELHGQAWKPDIKGFVRTGARGMALFRPSVHLDNYRFEFLTVIERNGVGWVVRAANTANYYALRFVVMREGRRPLVSLVRRAVIRRLPEVASEVPAAVMFHYGTPFRVATEVHGARFTVSVEDQVVDTWIDDRLASGGVGFLAEAGDAARIYWIKLSRNTDLIGRTCAVIAHPELQTITRRSRQPIKELGDKLRNRLRFPDL